jgi:AraC-like DNA-binding protein
MSGTSGHARGRVEPPQREPRGAPIATIQAEYLAQLVELAGRFNVRPEALLSGTGIPASALDAQGKGVPRAAFLQVIERALVLTREPGLGFYHGLSLKLSAHGPLGLLAMTAGTLGDALSFAERFLALRTVDLTLRTEMVGASCVVSFGSDDTPPALQVFMGEAMLMMLITVGRMLVGHPIEARAELAFPEPAHFKRFAHLVPGGVRFGADTHRLILAKSDLARSVVTADSVTARRIERELARDLQELKQRASTLLAVRRYVRGRGKQVPSLEEAAEHLGVSARTLKRKLAEQGTSYRAVVDAHRKERALALLSDARRPLAQVARELGYDDVASLHRSFRRWYGRPPRVEVPGT